MKGLYVEHARAWSPASEFRASAFSLVVASLHKRIKSQPINPNQSTNIWRLTRPRENGETTRTIHSCLSTGIHTWRCFLWKGRQREKGTDSLCQPWSLTLVRSSAGLPSIYGDGHWNSSSPREVQTPSGFLSGEVKREWRDIANQDHKEDEVYFRLWKKARKGSLCNVTKD